MLRTISWVFYIIGIVLVGGNWLGFVPGNIAWAGWVIGMIGWGMQFLPAYKNER